MAVTPTGCIADGFGYTGPLEGTDLDGDGIPAQAVGTWSVPGPTLRAWDANQQKLVADSAHARIGPFYDVMQAGGGTGTAYSSVGDTWPDTGSAWGNWQYVTFLPSPTATGSAEIVVGPFKFTGTYNGAGNFELRRTSPLGTVLMDTFLPATSNYPGKPLANEASGPSFVANYLALLVTDLGGGNVSVVGNYGSIESPSGNTFGRPGIVHFSSSFYSGAGAVAVGTYSVTGMDVVRVHEEMTGLAGVHSVPVGSGDQCVEFEVTKSAVSDRSPCAALLLRIQPDGQAYFVLCRPGATQLIFGLLSSLGVFQQLGTGSLTALGVGDSAVLKVIAGADTLTAFWDDVEVGSWTNETLTGGEAGFTAFLPPNASGFFNIAGEPVHGAKIADADTFYVDHFFACICPFGGGPEGCVPCTVGQAVYGLDTFTGADVDEIGSGADIRLFDGGIYPDLLGGHTTWDWINSSGADAIGIRSGQGVHVLLEPVPEYIIYRAMDDTLDPQSHGMRQHFTVDHYTTLPSEIAVWVHLRASGNGLQLRLKFGSYEMGAYLESVVNSVATVLQSWTMGTGGIPAVELGAHVLALCASCEGSVTSLTATFDGYELGVIDDETVVSGTVGVAMLDRDAGAAVRSLGLTETAVIGCGTTAPGGGGGIPGAGTGGLATFVISVRKNNAWHPVLLEHVKPRKLLLARDLSIEEGVQKVRARNAWRTIVGGVTEDFTGEPEFPGDSVPDQACGQAPLSTVPLTPIGAKLFFCYGMPLEGNTEPFEAAVRATGPGWTPSELAICQAVGKRLIGTQGGANKFRIGGPYDPDLYDAWAATFAPVDTVIHAYATVGVYYRGPCVADDVGLATTWPPNGLTVTEIERMAGVWTGLYPWMEPWVRCAPDRLIAKGATGGTFSQLKGALAQYEWHMGNVSDWRDRQMAGLSTLGLSYILMSLNFLDGGNGSSGIRGYLARQGGRASWYMSPDEVLAYGTVLASTPGIDGFGGWRWDTEFLSQPGMIDNLATLRNLMVATP